MTTNKAAFDCLRSAATAAQLAYHDAKTAKEGQVFLDLYNKFDDEVDEMRAQNLSKSSAAYATLTPGIKTAQKELDDVVGNIQGLLKATDTALKVVTLFAKVLAIL